MMSVLPATAGRNANGALIVHTNDAVTYTVTGDYCLTSYLPASCEAAITRTDKDEDTPAMIWLLAAFPDTANPAVTTIQFGIEHNLPANEGYFERYGKCGELEMPDTGWPETGFGNLVSFGSTVKTDLLFAYYWFSVYGFEDAYFGTTTYPSTDEAKFVDDSAPPVEDLVTKFGTVRWYAAGSNDCPGEGGGLDAPEGDESIDAYPNAEILPPVIYSQHGSWTFLITGVPSVSIRSTSLRINSTRYSPVGSSTPEPDASVWDFDYPPISPGSLVRVEVETPTQIITFTVALRDTLTPDRPKMESGKLLLVLEPGTFSWDVDPVQAIPASATRPRDEVLCNDPALGRILDLVGVTAISKAYSYASDGDSSWISLQTGRKHSVPERYRSTYTIYFPDRHSALAIAEALVRQEEVKSASWIGKLETRVDPCDGTIRDLDYYNQQWEIQSLAEFPGTPGLQANYAWCASTGSPTQVYVLDHAVNCSHEVLTGAIAGGDCPGVQPDNHGTVMAALIAGRMRDGHGKLSGAAPGVMLYPLVVDSANPLSQALDTVLDLGQPGTLQIISMSMSGQWSSEEIALYQAYADSIYACDIAWFAASPESAQYPAALNHVIGVAGITEDGDSAGYLDAEGVAGPYGPIRWTPNASGGYSATEMDGTSVATALTAGGAAVLAGCTHTGVPVQTLYDKLLSVQGEYGHLVLGTPCGYTGIEDVSAFETEALEREIRLTWIVEVEEGIDEITLSAAPSCWGAFAETIYTFHNPLYSDDFMHYEVVWTAPYNRNYYFRLDVMGTGGTRSLTAMARPLNGYVMQRCVRLENVALAVNEDTAELSWDRCGRPSGTGAMEYWVYRGQGLHLSGCGPNAMAWGDWFRGGVDDYVDLCDQDIPDRRCWIDQDLELGYPYTYRVAAVGRETIGGPIIWMSDLADERTGFAVGPAGVSVVESDPEVVVGPNPVRKGRGGESLSLFVPSRWSGMPIELEIVDVSGRVVWSMVGLASGNRMGIPLGDACLGPGVYFVRLGGGDGEHHDRRIVIIP